MFYGHDGRGLAEGELVTTTLKIIWAICLFVEAETENDFEKISTLLTFTSLANLQAKVVQLVFKNIVQSSPLLVKCQAYNTTLKLQHRVLIFPLFFSNNINLELSSVQIFSMIHFKK